jgi:hypothetical protein
VGVAERGYLSLQPSVPRPRAVDAAAAAEQSAIGMMSAALAGLRVSMPVRSPGCRRRCSRRSRRMARDRVLLSNLWPFNRWCSELRRPPAGRDLRTTTALTIFSRQQGQRAPRTGRCRRQLQVFLGDTTDKVVEHAQRVMAVPS